MERSAYFDNAKGLLIFLVVFGHLIQPYTGEAEWIHTLYVWIYTFHMPAFILVSGFFAKGSGEKSYILKLVKKLIVPYLIFQLIYTVYYFFIGKDGWNAGIFYPHWSLWFLFSLFCWHILLIFFKRMPAKWGLPFAGFAGMIVGYIGDIGHTFSLSRTIVFFPFFLAGYWLALPQMMTVKRKAVKVAAIFILVAMAIVLHIAPEFNSGWLLASKSYIDLGMEEFGGIARLGVYLAATVMVVSVLAWIPQKHFGWWTDLGRKTIYVYLLHGFFIQFIREKELFVVDSVLDILGLAVIAAFIVILLSSKLLVAVWQPFIEGKASILRNLRMQRKHGHV